MQLIKIGVNLFAQVFETDLVRIRACRIVIMNHKRLVVGILFSLIVLGHVLHTVSSIVYGISTKMAERDVVRLTEVLSQK